MFVGCAMLVAVVAMHEHVRWSAAPYIRSVAAAPRVDCLVVPGARIHADGTPYHLLIDRLTTAAELFALGKASRIVLSGRGDGGLGDDEVAAMRRWLIARGVPEPALVDDPLGLRTLATMQRWPRLCDARSAIVVSNPFHVERAVFLGRYQGFEVLGVAAPYGREYSRSTRWRNQGREVLARIRAWCDVYLGWS